MKPATLLFSLLAFAGTAHAAVTFTFTGTITQDAGNAFELGEAFSFSVTTNETLGAPNYLNDSSGVRWDEAPAPDGVIWSTMSISGATGSYQAPAPEYADADLRSDSIRPLYISAYTDSVTTGLGLYRGGEEFYFLEAWVSPSGTFASYGASMAVRPDNTFHNGTYALTTVLDAYIYTDGYDKEYRATFSSLTISGSSIPEPSAAAIVAGLGALAAISLRRRREARASTRGAS